MTLGNWNGLDHSGPDTNLDQTWLLMTKQDWVCLDHPRQNITVSNDTYRIWQTPGNWRLHHSIQTTLQRKGSKLGWTGPNFFYIRSVNFFVCVCFILFGIFFFHLRSSKTCCWETEVLNYQLWQLLFLLSLFMSLLCREYNLWYHFAGATQFGTKWHCNK